MCRKNNQCSRIFVVQMRMVTYRIFSISGIEAIRFLHVLHPHDLTRYVILLVRREQTERGELRREASRELVDTREEFAGRLGRKSFRCPAGQVSQVFVSEMWDGPQSRVATQLRVRLAETTRRQNGADVGTIQRREPAHRLRDRRDSASERNRDLRRKITPVLRGQTSDVATHLRQNTVQGTPSSSTGCRGSKLWICQKMVFSKTRFYRLGFFEYPQTSKRETTFHCFTGNKKIEIYVNYYQNFPLV